jgi:hypothetical protein
MGSLIVLDLSLFFALMEKIILLQVLGVFDVMNGFVI